MYLYNIQADHNHHSLFRSVTEWFAAGYLPRDGLGADQRTRPPFILLLQTLFCESALGPQDSGQVWWVRRRTPRTMGIASWCSNNWQEADLKIQKTKLSRRSHLINLYYRDNKNLDTPWARISSINVHWVKNKLTGHNLGEMTMLVKEGSADCANFTLFVFSAIILAEKNWR